MRHRSEREARMYHAVSLQEAVAISGFSEDEISGLMHRGVLFGLGRSRDSLLIPLSELTLLMTSEVRQSLLRHAGAPEVV